MGLIKKHYQKIISYGLIILSILLFIIIIFTSQKLNHLWYPLFILTVGLTLLPLSKGGK